MPDSPSPTAPAPGQEGAQLLHLIHGYAPTQLIYVAAKLGLADILSAGPQTVDALAGRVPVPPALLYRLLRGLVNCGVLALSDDGHFTLAPLGARLQTHHPASLRGLAILHGEVFYPIWGTLQQTLQTGQPALEQMFGMDFFAYLAAHPDAEAIFNNFITRTATQIGNALLPVYDFSAAHVLVDLGGAQGTLLAPILAAYPHLQGILMDQERVLQGNEMLFEAAGLGDRCTLQAGDFFVAVPGGGDVYLLSQVLHDWDDARAATILANCRRVIPATGQVLIVERLMPDRLTPPESAVEFDLNMLVLTGGRERTVAEFTTLLAGAGFQPARTIPLVPPFVLIEAKPAVA